MALLQIQHRNDTAANWISSDPVMLLGEIGFESDTGKYKWGDGVTAWASLGYNIIGDVADVSITSVANNEVLAYDSGSSEWINQTPAEAGLSAVGHAHVLADITDSGALAALATVGTTQINNSAVTFAKMQNIPTANFLGRVTAATGNVEDLTATQATSILNNFTSALKGLAPLSGGGTTNFLRADGSWAAPPDSTPVDSVFGRTGTVVAQQADYDGFFLTPAEGNAAYLGIGAKAADSDLLDGIDILSIARTDIAEVFTSDLTVQGAFTSLGIDDNATAERLQVSDINSVFSNLTNSIVYSSGLNGYGSFFAQGSGTNSSHIFMGNSTSGENSRITSLDDGSLLFSTDGGISSAFTIDASQDAAFAGTVTINNEFGLTIIGAVPRFHQTKTGVGVDQGKYRSTGEVLRILDDSTTNVYEYFRLTRSGTGAGVQVDTLDFTAVTDITLNSDVIVTGTFTSLGIDDNATVSRVLVADGAAILGATGAAYGFQHAVDDQLLFISGGNVSNVGGNILLYGGTEATTPGDILFRSDSDIWMQWDESAGGFEIFTGIGAKTSALTINSTQAATFAALVTMKGIGLILDPTTASTNAGIELGNQGGVATSSFIDFHSGATVVDYDSRIIATGGNGTIGQGDLKFVASSITPQGILKITAYDENADQYTATTGTRDLDLNVGTYFYPSADLGTAVITFTFSNLTASGRVSSWMVELLGADGATLTWPAGVDWGVDGEPTWTAGIDVAAFWTRTGSTKIHATAAILNS